MITSIQKSLLLCSSRVFREGKFNILAQRTASHSPSGHLLICRCRCLRLKTKRAGKCSPALVIIHFCLGTAFATQGSRDNFTCSAACASRRFVSRLQVSCSLMVNKPLSATLTVVVKGFLDILRRWSIPWLPRINKRKRLWLGFMLLPFATRRRGRNFPAWLLTCLKRASEVAESITPAEQASDRKARASWSGCKHKSIINLREQTTFEFLPTTARASAIKCWTIEARWPFYRPRKKLDPNGIN